MSPVKTPMSDIDRESLIAFYLATDGQHWMQSTNWLSGTPLNRWFGVNTDDSGRVTALQLAHNHLRGLIPPELANLTNLEQLDLNRNILGKSISHPRDPRELRNIVLLFLRQGKKLAREEGLPPELGNLYNLKFLDLSHNSYEWWIPRTFGNLTNLEHLDLSRNNLKGPIPEEIGNLTNLRHLDLSHNRIFGEIPAALGTLTNLERMEIGWQKEGLG